SDRGVMAGRVAFTDVFTGDVGIALQRPIALNDVLEVWVSRGGRVRQKVGGLTVGGGPVEAAPPGARAVVKFEEKRHHIANGDRVFIVERERAAGGEKRIPIELDVALAVGEPLKVTASSGGVSCRVRGDARAEKARTKPVTLDLLERQLGKLGDAAYRIKKLDARIDGAPMLSVSEINEVRRRFVADLDQRRLSPYRARPCPAPHDAKHFFERTLKGRSVKRETALVGLHVSASDIEASVACVGAGADRIYLRVQGGSGALDHKSRKVIREHPEIRPAFGNIAKDVELEGILADAIGIWGGGVALCDNLGLSRLLLESGFEAVLDYHINVLNSLTAMDLAESAYSGFTASVEADSEDIAGLVRMSPVPVETIVHGAIEVMTAEHPVAVRKKTEGLAPYEIVDPKDFRFPVVLDERARTHIYNSKDLCLLEELPAVLATGVSSIRLQLELYAPARARAVVEVYRRALAEIQAIGEVGDGTLAKAATVHNSFSDHTTGHFYRPVL
ncbi:MAG: DUF3656 domain-containing protein, partial [Actinobacteria bacterium]|nr:DUF3656 domain-containing protein [Actinomycetota bacterium]